MSTKPTTMETFPDQSTILQFYNSRLTPSIFPVNTHFSNVFTAEAVGSDHIQRVASCFAEKKIEHRDEIKREVFTLLLEPVVMRKFNFSIKTPKGNPNLNLLMNNALRNGQLIDAFDLAVTTHETILCELLDKTKSLTSTMSFLQKDVQNLTNTQ